MTSWAQHVSNTTPDPLSDALSLGDGVPQHASQDMPPTGWSGCASQDVVPDAQVQSLSVSPAD